MDKPKATLDLSILEFKMLALQGIAGLGVSLSQMSSHLQKQQAITKQMLGELDQYFLNTLEDMQKQWEEVRIRLKGWEQKSRPLIAEYEAQQAAQQPLADPIPTQVINGTYSADAKSDVPKRKGGWPRGKPRKPKANTSAAVLPPVTQ